MRNVTIKTTEGIDTLWSPLGSGLMYDVHLYVTASFGTHSGSLKVVLICR